MDVISRMGELEDFKRATTSTTTSTEEKGKNGTGIPGRNRHANAYRFLFSEIEALGEELENQRQLFYNSTRPSCTFDVLVKEAYCVLRGFTRHLGDLP